MGSWTCLFLSSRRRRFAVTDRWRGPLTASQIPFEPGAFTAPVVDYEPPPFGVGGTARSARRRPLPRCTATPATAAARRQCRGFRGPPRRRHVRRRGAAAGARGDRRRRPIAQLRPMLTPPLLDMVFALARGARSPTRRRCCVECGCAPPPSTIGIPTRRWPPRCSPPIPVGGVFGPSPAASKSRRVDGAWWPCRSDNDRCRETPSASNASSRRRRARSLRCSPMPEGIPASTGRGRWTTPPAAVDPAGAGHQVLDEDAGSTGDAFSCPTR